MKSYEAPRIELKKLTFFESIASNCWGGNNFYFDANNDKDKDCGEGIDLNIHNGKSGCEMKTDLSKYIKQNFFKHNKRGFETWYDSSGVGCRDTVNATMVGQIFHNSGCYNPPRG